MKFYEILPAAGLLAFLAGPAPAMECENVEMRDTVQRQDQTLVLNGMGVRKEGRTKLGVVGLYLTAKTTDPAAIIANDQPRHITIEWLRDVGLAQVFDKWKQAIDKNEAFELAAYQERLDSLQAAMTPFIKGQRAAFSYLPGQGTDVIIQGETQRSIEGADFAAALFSVWLGPEPVDEGLKAGLLGGPCP